MKNILEKYKEAVEHRSQNESKYRRNEKYYLGKHWKNIDEDSMSIKDFYPVSNHIFKVIEVILPIMADIEPTMYIDPYKKDDINRERAKKLQLLLQHEWMDQSVPQSLWRGVKSGLIHGHCAFFVQSLIQESKAKKIGFEVEPLTVWEYFLDPYTKEFKDSRYFIRRVFLPLDVIKERYKTNPAVEDKETVKRYYVDEFWTKDKVYTIIAGTIIRTEPNKYGRLPFALWVDYEVPGRIEGLGEVDILLSMQREVNVRMKQIIDNANAMGNGIWVGTDEDQEIDNTPGGYVHKDINEQLKREMPVPLANSYFTQIDNIEREIEQISGVNELSQGRVKGEMSGEALKILKHSNYTRIRQKTRNLEETLRQIGGLITNIILTRYELPIDIAQNEQMTPIKGREIGEFEYQVRVLPGTMRIKNEADDMQLSLMLYKMGAFGNPQSYDAIEELLTGTNYIGKKRVLDKLKTGGNNGNTEQTGNAESNNGETGSAESNT